MTTEAIAAPPRTKSQVLRSFNVADFPALGGLEEEWRFTPLKRLGELVTATTLTGTPPSVEYGDLPSGVTVSTVDSVEPVLTPFDRISALAYGSAAGVTLIEVAPETSMYERPSLSAPLRPRTSSLPSTLRARTVETVW